MRVARVVCVHRGVYRVARGARGVALTSHPHLHRLRRCDEKDELMEDFLDDYCKELNEDMGLLCTEEGDIVSVRETIGDGSQ